MSQDGGLNNNLEDLRNMFNLEEVRKNLFSIDQQGQGSENIINKQNSDNKKEVKPLKSHASFMYDFDEHTYNIKTLIIPYLNLHKNTLENPYFTVTNSIKFIEKDNSLEICRRRFYYDLPNNISLELRNKNIKSNKEYCHEKIIISKEKGLMMLSEDEFKREGVLITNNSILNKTVKFKKLQSAQELLFYQNLYYYKNIMGVKLIKDTISKMNFKKLDKKDLDYHEYLNNLF
jgi:hypothetical protein